MKRFLRVTIVVFSILILSVALAHASDLTFHDQSAVIVDSVDTDLSLMNSTGLLVEIKVVNTGDEVKLWPSDFKVGIHNGTEELRVPGFIMTNAVSDPEDEMNFRYFQGATIRIGTRHFKIFFTEMMNWYNMTTFQDVQVEEAFLYFIAPASSKFPVTSALQ